MRVDMSFKYLKKSQFINNILDHNLKKIERRLKIFKPNQPIHISLHLEKNPHKEQYFCRSHVYLPSSKVLAVGEKAANASLAINKTFSALSKQLNKEKNKWQKRRRKPKPPEPLDFE